MGIFNSGKTKKHNANAVIFPYSMDNMLGMDIDPLLKQPTMLVLHRGGEDCDKMVTRILKSIESDLPNVAQLYIVQAITGTFALNHLETKFFTGNVSAQEAVQALYDETNRRLDFVKNHLKNQVFYGSPIYFLFDSFSEISKKEYDPIFGQLVRIMVCARQTNIHTIIFDNAFSFHSTDSGAFSSFAVLSGAYENKYKDIVPKEFRDIPYGYFYFDPNHGERGIYSIDLAQK